MYMSALKTLYGGQFTSDQIIIELGRLFPKVVKFNSFNNEGANYKV